MLRYSIKYAILVQKVIMERALGTNARIWVNNIKDWAVSEDDLSDQYAVCIGTVRDWNPKGHYCLRDVDNFKLQCRLCNWLYQRMRRNRLLDQGDRLENAKDYL